MKIAILHPQCRIQGGAIKMALLSTHLLTEAGHDTILYTFSHSLDCFTDLQKNIKIELHKPAKNIAFSPLKKLISIITLAWYLRHVDIIIANNPPMQVVAALTKVFSLKIKVQSSKGRVQSEVEQKKAVHNFAFLTLHFSLSTSSTIWWHHHTPWYFLGKSAKCKVQSAKGATLDAKEKLKNICSPIFWKGIFERTFIMPFIDTMIVTSHFVGEQLKTYSGRDATVIHPVLPVIPTPVIPESSPLPSSSCTRIHCDSRDEHDTGIQVNKLPGNGSLNVGENDTGLDSRLRGNDGDKDDEQVLLFTHGRLESGKGIETIVRVWEEIKREKRKEKKEGSIHLTIYGTGSLEQSLRAQGIDVQPYDSESTLRQIANNGMTSLAIYASTIDAFGMTSLEAQSTGISTLILDRGGARETLVSDVSGECVGRLVDTESELCATARYFIIHKKFPENMSIVNFSHTIDYFTLQRLSSDLLSAINKTKE